MKDDIFDYFDKNESGPEIFAFLIFEHAMRMDFDNFMRNQVYSLVEKPSREELDTYNEAELYNLFLIIQKSNIESLYKKYLPDLINHFVFDFKLELSPFTFFLYKNIQAEEHYLRYLEHLNIKYKINEQDAKRLTVEQFTDLTGFNLEILNDIEQSLLPASVVEKFALIHWYANIPKLRDYYNFFRLYHYELNKEFKRMYRIYKGSHEYELPEFSVCPMIYYSANPIPYSLSKDINIEDVKSNLSSQHTNSIRSLEKIFDANKSAKSKNGNICEHCGNVHEKIKIPEELLLTNILNSIKELSVPYSFKIYEKIKNDIIKEISKKINNITEELNLVEEPNVLIMVEGESEEVAIPVMALKLGHHLRNDKIKVFNSGSKEKILEDFQKLKRNNPKLPIIVILDSDAKKESDDLNRISKSKRNLYKIYLIQKGTFEDLFDIDITIKILNDIFEGKEIIRNDWDTKKSFLQNVNKLLWEKKKGKFDKVEFAKRISHRLSLNEIPEQIKEVIDQAYVFKLNRRPLTF